jgi:hypothetical protein
MIVQNKCDVLLLCGAFHRAWCSLLIDERLTVENMEEMPSLLLGALLDAAIPGNLSERELVTEALARLADYESELQEQSPEVCH